MGQNIPGDAKKETGLVKGKRYQNWRFVRFLKPKLVVCFLFFLIHGRIGRILIPKRGSFLARFSFS